MSSNLLLLFRALRKYWCERLQSWRGQSWTSVASTVRSSLATFASQSAASTCAASSRIGSERWACVAAERHALLLYIEIPSTSKDTSSVTIPTYTAFSSSRCRSSSLAAHSSHRTNFYFIKCEAFRKDAANCPRNRVAPALSGGCETRWARRLFQNRSNSAATTFGAPANRDAARSSSLRRGGERWVRP